MRPHRGIALIAVLDPAQIAAIVLRVFQEGNEVGDTDDVDGRLQPVAEVHGTREHHVASIATAEDSNAVLVE